MKKKELKIYELAVPVKETWYFQVEATSKAEAWERYDNNHESVDQIGSDYNWAYGRKRKVIQVIALRHKIGKRNSDF